MSHGRPLFERIVENDRAIFFFNFPMRWGWERIAISEDLILALWKDDKNLSSLKQHLQYELGCLDDRFDQEHDTGWDAYYPT